ncbi:MAG TPA: VOC family protein [Acidimicrobiia bacterium]|nr:VOC family protein [Acidimicrobiia bacterium]
MSQTTTLMDVRTVAVPVTDQDRAVEFYVDTLGFEKRMDAPIGEGFRCIEVAPPGAGVSIALSPASDTSPAGVDSGIRLTTVDVDGEHAAMRRRGIDADDVLRWQDLPAMFTFRDVDGNTLYVVEVPSSKVQ